MNKLIVIIVSLISSLALFADDYDNDSYIRENPQIVQDSVFENVSFSQYNFLNLNKNKLTLNNSDLSIFFNRLQNSSTDTINIVHIGDSHIQADMSTKRTRTLLQNKFGNAGRGIIIPFKLSKTNEPRDYSITSTSIWTNKKAIKRSDYCHSFTGISISPQNKDYFDLTISTLSKFIPEEFNNIKLYHTGEISIDSLNISDEIVDSISYNVDEINIKLSVGVNSLTLYMSSDSGCAISGALLSNSKAGIVYNAIGNNGATFNTYNSIGNIGKRVSQISPQLIILSLGANDAYSKISPTDFYNSIHKFVSDIQTNNPDASIILTTPMESQKRKYIRKKGRRRRKSYIINERVLLLRNEILRYGKEHKIPVYDWFEIAGGENASQKWHNHKLMGRDRIHYTRVGYEIQGELFFNALLKEYNSYINSNCHGNN